MGFFAQQTGENALANQSDASGRPLDFTPGTYLCRIDKGLDVKGDPAKGDHWRLFGLELTVLEVVHSYTAAQNEVFDASRRPGQRCSHKWDLNMKYGYISARNAKNLALSIMNTHGFEAAMRTRDGYWDAFVDCKARFEAAGDEPYTGPDPYAVVADLVMDDPELFAGLVIEVQADELLDKDGQRRKDPRTKCVLRGVDEATALRALGHRTQEAAEA